MSFDKVTEMPSVYRNLELMSTDDILYSINNENGKVHVATSTVIAKKMIQRGRLIYIGAGTSGRLGVLDASECPPTFGVEPDKVIGVMAGGDEALRFGIEDAEDNEELGWKDLERYQVNDNHAIVARDMASSIKRNEREIAQQNVHYLKNGYCGGGGQFYSSYIAG